MHLLLIVYLILSLFFPLVSLNYYVSITIFINHLMMALRQESSFLIYQRDSEKIWQEGLLFKLKQNGISGNHLNVITDFLYQRNQRVVLNGQHSSWTNIQAGVPQGSILGSLFFLIYINDLSDGLTSNPKLFADDTSLFSVVQNINSKANDLNSNLMKISDWAFQWKIRFPLKKAQSTKLIIPCYILMTT